LLSKIIFRHLKFRGILGWCHFVPFGRLYIQALSEFSVVARTPQKQQHGLDS
jgi:hypothetical protein